MALLHRPFERQAERRPGAVAVVAGDRTIAYGELDRRGAAVAERLRGAGVGRDDIVGICAGRSFELVVGILGILRAGAAYLPLDPDLPDGRIAAIAGDASPRLVLADADARERLTGTFASEPIEIGGGSVGGGSVGDGPGAPGAAEDLAYVIYTSGSTGRPKGVMCTHAGIVNRLEWMQDRFRLGAEDRVLHKTSIGFDVSVWELLWPLSEGARLVLAPPGAQRDPEALGATIRRHGVTVAHFVPAMLRAFVRSGELSATPTLRTVVCSGEALPAELRDEFFAHSDAELHNLYGPTEASIDVTHHHCRRDDRSPTVPIGRAITGVGVRVLDDRLRPVPRGAAGEIFIGGVALARGYLGRPDLTAERFVTGPADAGRGGGGGRRLYRTGDAGRVLPNGEIEFLGRTDDQVKVRGVRIELGEVEAVLGSHPAAPECAVLAEPDGDSSRLVAFVGERSPGDAELRDFMAERLPEQAVPATFVRVLELPRLPSGKVDRGTLRARLAEQVLEEREGAAAATPAEVVLADVWRLVLGREDVGRDDNFFTLGGDSIRSIEVVFRARARGLAITAQDVFRHQTLRAVAGAARAVAAPNGSEPGDEAAAPFALVQPRDRDRLPAGIEDAFPLSSLLGGLVAETEGNPHYRIYTTTLTLRGEYRSAPMRDAFATLVERHPALRSSVDLERYDEPLQLVHADVPVTVDEIDARGSSPVEWDGELRRWLERERGRRFDWSSPPLLRLTVHQLADGRFQLTLSEPYLDGWSATLALAELLTIYDARGRGEAPDLPPAPTAAARKLVRAERAALRSAEHREALRSRLDGARPTLLPRLGSGGDGVRRPERVAVPVSPDVSDGLRDVARRAGVPLKSVLLAGHVHAIAALAGQREVLCGLMVNGRPETRGGDQAIGLFLNTVPLRARLDPGAWTDLIREVHAAEAEALRWRLYPYKQVLREHGGRPLFDSVFNFTHFRPYRRFDGEDGVELLAVEGSDQTYFPLTAQASLDLDGERVGLALEVNPEGFAGFQLDQLIDLHEMALAAIAGRPDSPHEALPLIGPRERRLRTRWPEPVPAPGPPARLDDLFERRRAATPEALAVFDHAARRTYAELDAGADRAALRVLAAGGGAPRRVGVCMRRSPLLVEALLGVLRLGAAYVPLDPEAPPARTAHVVRDAGVDVVLADGEGAKALRSTAAAIVRLDAEGARLPTDGRFPGLDATEGPHAGRGGSPSADVRLPAHAGSPDDAAHVIYTSGSTGSPKGVVTPHAAVVNRLRFMWRAHPYAPGEVGCARGSIAFVDSIAELLGGLLEGVPTFLLADDVREPRAVAEAIAAAGVTRLTIVPSLLRELLAGLDADGVALLADVSHWTLSGEPLATDLVDALRAAVPGATVLNLYGSTEVAGDVTAHVCEHREAGAVVPAGRPIDGATIHVVDGFGREVPTGTTGEVAVGGVALASGYLGDAELTAQRFEPAPAAGGARVFHTGDLGRLRSDGTLELLGRADRQLKVNGVRVEPLEVEAALLAHPTVLAAAVFGIDPSEAAGIRNAAVVAGDAGEAPPGNPAAAVLGGDAGGAAPRTRLVAHVETDLDDESGSRRTSTAGGAAAELRAFLLDRLPSAMVPTTIVPATELPRTATGKVDHAELARRTPSGEHRATPSGAEPKTDLQRRLAALWERELRTGGVGLDADFFQLGGDSLVAVRLLARIRAELGVALTLRDAFDHPTVRELAARIEPATDAADRMPVAHVGD